MVRLKVDLGITYLLPLAQFQFHNGSIKSRRLCFAQSLGSMFQFHNGSIKRFMKSHRRQDRIMFQFHNGSIKSRLGVWVIGWLDSSFNSTMVRLKEEGRLVATHEMFRFQFHNGSIKSSIFVWIQQLTLTFQFHNGSIKSWLSKRSKTTKKLVSIPQWFD